MKINKTIILVAVGLLLIIAITFWGLQNTHFEQDEWLEQGFILSNGWKHVVYGFSPVQLIFGTGRPLTRLLGPFLFTDTIFNSIPLTLYTLGFHFLNALLVFLIAQKLIKRKILSFIAAAFFIVNIVSSQAVTWFGAAFAVQPSTFLVLISILFHLQYLESENKTKLYLSWILGAISLYFKESGFFLLFLFALSPVLLKNKLDYKRYLNDSFFFLVFFGTFIIYRFTTIFNSTTSVSVTPVSFSGMSLENLFFTLISRLVLYPFTGLSLIFLPNKWAEIISFKLLNAYYPFITDKPDLIGFTVVMDLVAIVFSFLILIVLFKIVVKQDKRVLFFLLLFFALSLIPYIALPKGYAYHESRYYYISSAAAGLLLALFLKNLILIKNKIFVLVVFAFLTLIYFPTHIVTTHAEVERQISLTRDRKIFFSDLSLSLPTLKDNTNIFYFTGSKTWLVDKHFVPFQNGFGYTLMVIYYKSGKIPKMPVINGDFWMLGDEGIRSEGNIKFGYFANYKSLEAAVLKNHIPVKYIHAFYYDWETKRLRNITSQITISLERNTH